MEKSPNSIGLFLRGMAMGIAEVIPGVSGGTIAFITGIYEELLASIKGILSVSLLQALRREGLPGLWKAANGRFMGALLLGMATGVIGGVFGISHLLEHYPILLWAFFFGLILASAWYVGRQVKHWSLDVWVGLIAGTGIALWYTLVAPGQGSEALWFVFFSGVIAISALMLPGISGSFVLLLLGMYTTIIPAVKAVLTSLDTSQLIIVIVFAGGCLVGLATFSRVLTWTFRHYHDLTMAVLMGFMLGSLNKIWPWREVTLFRVSSSGEPVPVLEKSVWPTAYSGESYWLAAIALMLVGFGVVLLLERVGNSSEK
ncbi:MAG: DUF368 domain-containing protein [Lewinellaceae bacterium]|nr:DUF368 domain-containing protein [Lewinellaceae bacterium]